VTFDDRVRGHELGAPTILAGRVYVPDYATGSVIVYNATASRFASSIRVTGRQGKFDAFLKGEYLWLNDQASSRAVVVGSDGHPRSINKYAHDVAKPQPPSAGKHPPEQPPAPGPLPGRPPGVAAPGVPGPTLPPKPGAPGVPSSVVAKPGDASLTGSWVAPASGGSAIGYYVATAHPVDGAGPVTARTKRAVTSIVVPRLRNGVAYTLTVHAVNAIGHGAESPPTAPVTPLPGQPEPPAEVSVVAGEAVADLTWRPSTGRTLQPILGYHVYLELAADRSVVSTSDVTGATSSSKHFEGLSNGTAYVAEVAAYTAATESGRTASIAFTPATHPGAPVITGVTSGTYQVTLSWALPDDGGAPVSSYLVVVDGAEYATTGATSQVVGPRRGDRPFAFQIYAQNSVGRGPGSPLTEATPGFASYANWDHYKYRATIRSAPDQGSTPLGSTPTVPAGRDGELMPVYCQAEGRYFRDPVAPVGSHIWDRINYHGIVGYMNDLYVHTPGTNSDRRSPGIPQC